MLRPGVTRAILMAHGHRCQYCGNPATTADHITPVFLGGGSEFGNLIAACKPCNSSKGIKRLDEKTEIRLKTAAFMVSGLVEIMVSTFSQALNRSLRMQRRLAKAAVKN